MRISKEGDASRALRLLGGSASVPHIQGCPKNVGPVYPLHFHFQFKLDVHTYFTSIGGVRMELSAAGSVQPSVILTKAVLLENAEYPSLGEPESVNPYDATNEIVSMTDASEVVPARTSFMWPSCHCPRDDESVGGGGRGHFIARGGPKLCDEKTVDAGDLGRVDEHSTRSLEEDALWHSVEIRKAGPVFTEKHLENRVEGSYVVVSTGVNGKGIVAMGGVVVDLDGPVRATAHLPDYCFVGKDVFLKLVLDNRRNTTHYVVMEVMSNAKFDFVGGDTKVRRIRPCHKPHLFNTHNATTNSFTAGPLPRL